MDIQEIKTLLPHRPPFLLIDGVEFLEPGKKIIAWKNLSFSDPVFVGHFPQKPVYPGVLAVEALCQASCILGFKSYGITFDDESVYLLSSLDKVRFKGPMIPGDKLMLHAELVARRLNFYRFDCRAKVYNREKSKEVDVCTAEVLCTNRVL